MQQPNTEVLEGARAAPIGIAGDRSPEIRVHLAAEAALSRAWVRLPFERVRRWWTRGARLAPARVWEAAEDATAAFRPRWAGLTLTCRAGTFVVTQEKDAVDHVLEAGDRFRTTSRGRVAAWALRAGALEVGGARRGIP
jgi:hypothetical protein